MGSVAFREHTISFEEHGEGLPIVMLPGFQSEAKSWRISGFPDEIPDRRLIAVDPLGHGKSSKSHDPADYTPQRVVGHVTAVLDQLEIEAAPVWGFSRGGHIAAFCAEIAPDRCSAAVIGASPLGAAISVTQPALTLGIDALERDDWASYWSGYPVPLPATLVEYFEKINDPRANAAAIRAQNQWVLERPTLGLDETEVPRFVYFGSGEVFADALRSELDAHGVEYHEGEWSGHTETMMDPAGVTAVVMPFLSRHDL